MTCTQHWIERFEELKAYFDANGHSNVSANCKENPPLGRWVFRQRAHYRKMLESKQLKYKDDRIGYEEVLVSTAANNSTGRKVEKGKV